MATLSHPKKPGHKAPPQPVEEPAQEDSHYPMIWTILAAGSIWVLILGIFYLAW